MMLKKNLIKDLEHLPNMPPGPCWGRGAGRLKNSCPILSKYSL